MHIKIFTVLVKSFGIDFLANYRPQYVCYRDVRVPDQILLDSPILSDLLPPIKVLLATLLVTEDLPYVHSYPVIYERPPV